MDVGRREAAVKPTGRYLRRSMEKISPDRYPARHSSPVDASLNSVIGRGAFYWTGTAACAAQT